MLNLYTKEFIINNCKSIICFALLFVLVIAPWLIGWARILAWIFRRG